MGILVSRTFEIVTEESAAEGDAAERGFLNEREEMTFRELVEWLRGGECSAWPARGDIREWVTQDQGETRAFFEDGERESHSIHYHHDNPARKARYWRLAFHMAGIA